MLKAALKAEVNTYICCHRQERYKDGYALMLRNGRFQTCPVQQCSTGQLKLRLHGLSTNDFQEALSALLREEAIAGFSVMTDARSLAVWQDVYKAWPQKRERLYGGS